MNYKEKHAALMAKCDELQRQIDAGLVAICKRLGIAYRSSKTQ